MGTAELAVFEIPISLLLSALAVTVAITGASPLLIQLWAYQRISTPSVRVLCQNREIDEIEWWRFNSEEVAERLSEDAGTAGIAISNGECYIQVDRAEIILSGEHSHWTVKDHMSDVAIEIAPGRFWIRPKYLIYPSLNGNEESIPDFLPPFSSNYLGFPLSPIPSNGEMELVVYPSINSNEIPVPVLGSLPRFYGTLDLKPVRETYSITE